MQKPMAQEPHVFTIPASAPFLPALIEALMKDRLGLGFKPSADPLALASATIYLPTRRACRLAQKIFFDVLNSDAAILPRIVPIGDVDEDELAFAEAAIGDTAGATLDLPKPVGGLERKVLLAQLILKWAASPEMRGDGNFSLVASSPTAALLLAGELARLMDDMVMRQVPWDRLDGLVPTDMDEYWQKTLRFLKIAREYWPAVLQEKGRIEPAERRDRLIAAEAKRLATGTGPVIAAGSTGSIPATATLLATIAKLPHGALVRGKVPVDDSGGAALSDTPAGVFARLAAEATLDGLPPVTLLALLKHPLCRLDAAAVSTLERAILRGPRPKRGTTGLAHALQTFRVEREKFHRKEPSSLHRSDPRTAISDTEFNAA